MRVPKYGGEKSNKLIREARERFEASEKAKRDNESRYRRACTHYECRQRKTSSWRMPTFVMDPKLLSLVDTNVAREMKAIFGASPIHQMRPRGETDYELAQDWTDLIAFYCDRMRPRRVVEEILKTRRLAGNAFVLFGWHEWVDKKLIPQPVQASSEMMDEWGEPLLNEWGEPVTELQDVTDEAGRTLHEMTPTDVRDAQPWMWHIPYEEAFPDADFPTVQEGEFFIHMTYREKRYLEEKMKLGVWHKAATKRAMDSATDYLPDTIGSFLKWRGQDGWTTGPLLKQIEDREWFQVMEIWRADCRYVVINQEFIVRYDDSPSCTGRIPVYTTKRIALPGRLYAMSDFQAIESCLRNYHDMRNAGATEALFSVFGLITALPGAQIHRLIHEPGAVIPVRSHEDFMYHQRPNLGQQIAGQQMEIENGAMQEGLSLNDAFQGIQPDNSAKATNTSLAVQSAGLRLQSMDIDNIAEDFVIPWGDEFRELARHYETEDRIVQAIEDPSAPQRMLSMDVMRPAELDTVTRLATDENLELAKKRWLEALPLLQQMPSANQRELAEKTAKLMASSDAGNIVMSDEQMLEEQKKNITMKVELEAWEQQERARLMPAPPMPQPGMPGPGGPMPGPGPGGPEGPQMDNGMAEMAAELGAAQSL